MKIHTLLYLPLDNDKKRIFAQKLIKVQIFRISFAEIWDYFNEVFIRKTKFRMPLLNRRISEKESRGKSLGSYVGDGEEMRPMQRKKRMDSRYLPKTFLRPLKPERNFQQNKNFNIY